MFINIFVFLCLQLIPSSNDKEKPRHLRKANNRQNGLKYSFAGLIICVIVLVIFLGMYYLSI